MSIELQTGTECLISDSSDAELYAAFEGDGNYILRKPLDLTMSSTNTLIIGPGTGLQNGRHIRFKGTTEVTIPSGVQAEKRSNIVVVRTTISRDEDTMETLTHSEAMVLTGKSTMDGEPTDPEWIEGNLLDGDTIADFPIARVVTDGINVREPEPLYNVLASAADFRDSQSQRLSLWSGTLSRGQSVEVPGISSCVLVAVDVYTGYQDGTGSLLPIMCYVDLDAGRIRGLSGTSASVDLREFAVNLAVEGDMITLLDVTYAFLTASQTVGVWQDRTIRRIRKIL